MKTVSRNGAVFLFKEHLVEAEEKSILRVLSGSRSERNEVEW